MTTDLAPTAGPDPAGPDPAGPNAAGAVVPGDGVGLELLNVFVLRGAGFPATDALLPGTGGAAATAARIVALTDDLDRLHATINGELAAVPAAPIARAVRHRVRRRLRSRVRVEDTLPPDSALQTTAALLGIWNDAVAELARLRSTLADEAAAELAAADDYLRRWHAQPKAEEAVWFSSHSAAHGMAGYAGSGRGGATARRVALRYLQRLTVKNETTSFFGPFQYGTVCPPGEGRTAGEQPGPVLRFAADSRRLGARSSYLARHVIDALAARIAAELVADPATPLVAHPLVEPGVRAITVGGRTVAVPPALCAALRAGPLTAGSLAPAVRAALSTLVRAGLVTVALAPPSTSLDDLGDLRAAVAAQPAPAAAVWLGRLDALAAAVEAVRTAPWPDRRAACGRVGGLLTEYGVRPGERAAGSLYTDRQPIYEECAGGLTGLALHADRFGRFAAPLAAVLRVHAAYAAEVRRDAAGWLRDRWAEAGLPPTARLSDVLERLQGADEPDYRKGSPSADALWHRLDLIAPEDARRVDVGAAAVADLFGDVLPDEPFVCSPDLMLRGLPGAGPAEQLVVGEVHHGVQPWCWLVRDLSEQDRAPLRAAVAAWARRLAGSRTPVTLVEPRFTGKTFTLEYPGGLAVERVGRSALPRDRVLSLRDVLVDEPTMTLRTAGGVTLALMPTAPVSPLSRAFGPLVLWGPRTPPLIRHRPRVTVDGVVWFRETWRIDAAGLAPLTAARDAAALLVASRALRTGLGLPRFVYVTAAGEPKPVFADLDSVTYCDMLARLVAGRSEALVSEALPTPDEAVLRCADGVFSSELRTAILVRGHR